MNSLTAHQQRRLKDNLECSGAEPHRGLHRWTDFPPQPQQESEHSPEQCKDRHLPYESLQTMLKHARAHRHTQTFRFDVVFWLCPDELTGLRPSTPALRQNRGVGKPAIHMSTISTHILLLFLTSICDRGCDIHASLYKPPTPRHQQPHLNVLSARR